MDVIHLLFNNLELFLAIANSGYSFINLLLGNARGGSMILGNDLFIVKFNGGDTLATFPTLAQAKAFCQGVCFQARALRKIGIVSCAGLLDIVHNGAIVDTQFNMSYDGEQ